MAIATPVFLMNGFKIKLESNMIVNMPDTLALKRQVGSRPAWDTQQDSVSRTQ